MISPERSTFFPVHILGVVHHIYLYLFQSRCMMGLGLRVDQAVQCVHTHALSWITFLKQCHFLTQIYPRFAEPRCFNHLLDNFSLFVVSDLT